MKAAAASIIATPPMAVPLCGSGFPETPWEDIADDIEWNAIRLVNGNDETILISGDFLSIGSALADIASKVLPHLPRERLLITATHTHSAPVLDQDLPILGQFNQAAFSYMAERLTLLLQNLMKTPLVSSHWKYGTSKFHGAVYRRRTVWRLTPKPKRKTMMFPNPSVAIPDDIHMMILEEANNNRPLAIMWSFACHPTCFPSKRSLSADYPGAIRAAFRKKVDRDIPTVFLQGYCGDLRPKLYDQNKKVKSKLKRLLYGTSFGHVSYSQFDEWVSGLTHAAMLAYRSAHQSVKQNGNIATARLESLPLSDLQNGESPPNRPLNLYYLSLTKDITLLAMSCEPVFGYEQYIQRPEKVTIAVGYADHIYGYLPTDKQLSEGGYEAEGFRDNFSLSGTYKKNVEKILATAIKKIIK